MAASGSINWPAIGVIVAGVGVLEAPLTVLAAAAWRWARNVDKRLGTIEARSRQRRAEDYRNDE